MADNPTPSPANGGRIGRARTADVRSSATQDTMNKNRDSIKKTWNLQPNQEVEDAFPSAIKPKHLGVSALSKLKAIASRTKTLAAAQALFLDVSKKSDGTPEPFGHKHACSILDTLKSGETSTSKASKAGIKENTTSKSATESITSHNTAPAKVPHLIALGSGLRAPFSIGKAQQRAPEAVMGAGGLQKNVKAAAPIVFTIPKKRGHSAKDSDTQTAKKVRKENEPIGLVNEQSNAGKKSIIEAFKDKTHAGQASRSKAAFGAVVEKPKVELVKTASTEAFESKANFRDVADNEDPLDRKMAEHLRANAAFFAGSYSRQTVYETDTIRVAHPEDPQSFIQSEQAESPVSSSTNQPQDWLKLHCLGLHDTIKMILPSRTSLQRIACLEQRPMVEEVICVIDQAVNQLKTDIEAIFARPA